MRNVLPAFFLVAFLVNPLSARELTGTLRQIQESGKVRIGYRQAQPPMSFLGEDGLPAGYSVDICKEVVTGITRKVGKKVQVEYVPVTAEDRFRALWENRIDLLCGWTTKTLSRSELVDFTLLTYPTGASLMTLRSRNIGNDFGGQTGPLIEDSLFRRFFVPHLKRLADLGHDHGLGFCATQR